MRLDNEKFKERRKELKYETFNQEESMNKKKIKVGKITKCVKNKRTGLVTKL